MMWKIISLFGILVMIYSIGYYQGIFPSINVMGMTITNFFEEVGAKISTTINYETVNKDCMEMMPINVSTVNKLGLYSNTGIIIGLRNGWENNEVFTYLHEGKYEGENVNLWYGNFNATKKILNSEGVVQEERHYEVYVALNLTDTLSMGSNINEYVYTVVDYRCKPI